MVEYNEQGERIKDDVLLLLINGHWEDIPFKIPGKKAEPDWEILVDTGDSKRANAQSYCCGEVFDLKSRSLVLFRQPGPVKTVY